MFTEKSIKGIKYGKKRRRVRERRKERRPNTSISFLIIGAGLKDWGQFIHFHHSFIPGIVNQVPVNLTSDSLKSMAVFDKLRIPCSHSVLAMYEGTGGSCLYWIPIKQAVESPNLLNSAYLGCFYGTFCFVLLCFGKPHSWPSGSNR